ncbi:hypothetical protein DICA3_C18514 [Diutina catenulata]
MSHDSNPSWYQHHNRRVIPNHLEAKKKSSFQLSGDGKKSTTTQRSVVDDKFNMLSFGSNNRDKATNFDDSVNETIADTVEEVTFGDDLPPARSIHDLAHEEIVKPRKNKTFVSKDPSRFASIFGGPAAPQEPLSPEVAPESAVIVFGYSECRAAEIIRYFRDCGPILEDFDTGSAPSLLIHSNSQAKIVPIFCGSSWVKITYANAESALDALQRNGQVFNGEFLGVIPYSKDAVEKIERRQLSPTEDVGALSPIVLASKAPKDAHPSQSPSLVSKIDIKDGSKLFLHNPHTNSALEVLSKTSNESEVRPKEKIGWVDNVTKKLFGFYEV